MELWDAYYSDGTKAGIDLVRGEPIPEGLFHLVCEILVRHKDGSFLLMQRDLGKEGYPGKLEASAGGSVLKGECAFDGALRELREETGITADSLTPLYRISDGRHNFYCGFLCVTDCPKDGITLQEGETISYRWLNPHEFMTFMASDECIDVQRTRLAEYLKTIG